MKIILKIIMFILLFGLSPVVHADAIPPAQPIKLYGLDQIPVKCKDIEGWRCIGEYYVDDNYNKREPVNSSQGEGKFDLGSAVEEDKLIVLQKDGYYKETEMDSFNEWTKSRLKKLNSQERKKQTIYHNAEGHFSFDMPNGCKEMTKDVLKGFSYLMQSKFSSGFESKGEGDYFILLQVDKTGRFTKDVMRALSYKAVKGTNQDLSSVFKDVQSLKIGEVVYNNKTHIIFRKIQIRIPSYSRVIPGVQVSALTNDGMVLMSMYSANNFDASISYFKQITDSFSFDKGYQYFDGQEETEKSKGTWHILPKSIAAFVLLLMGMFLSKHWRNGWLKIIGLALIAVVIDQIILYLHSTDLSLDFVDGLDISLAILIGIFWYKQYRRIKK